MPTNKSPLALTAIGLAVLLVTSGCLSGPLGSDLTTDQIGERIEQKYTEIDSYEANVTTTISGANMDQTTVMHTVAKPKAGMTYTEYTSPDSMAGDLAVSNGSAMWTYDASENTAQKLDLSGLELPMTPNYGQLIEQFTNQYDITQKGTATVADRDTYVLELTPKNDTEVAMNGTVWIDTERWFPVKTELSMSVQNETTTVTTVYRDLTFNTGVPNSTFEYEPPADATVETTTLPSIQTYDSRDAAAQNVSYALPEPDVSESFNLNQVSVTRSEGNVSVSIQYANETTSLSVMKRNYQMGTSPDGEMVSIHGETGTYQNLGSLGIVTWDCGGYKYSVSGSLSEAALIATAESIECTSTPTAASA